MNSGIIKNSRKDVIWYLSVLFLIIISVFIFKYNQGILIFFSIFLFGSGVYFFDKKNPDFHFKLPVLLIIYSLFFTLLAATRLGLVHTSFNILVGLLSAFVVLHFLKVELKIYIRVIALFLSNISYTLYIVHFPFIALFTAIFGIQSLEYNYKNLLIFGLTFIITVLFAYFVWYLFERNTGKLRDIVITYLKY